MLKSPSGIDACPRRKSFDNTNPLAHASPNELGARHHPTRTNDWRNLTNPDPMTQNNHSSMIAAPCRTVRFPAPCLRWLACLLLVSGLGGPAMAAKPNVLFIAIDDLRPELGCYGDTQAKTPHIDKLATQGMRFDRAYCQVPICMGSRASLLTGILPTPKRFVGDCRIDVDTPQAATLPETFRKNGYTAIANGKIFHTPNDTAERSWSEALWNYSNKNGNNLESHDPETVRHLSKTKQRGRIYELPDVPDNAYPDGRIAEKTIADLQHLKQDGKPFFLACGFIKPHMPFYAPKKYWDLYEREKIKIADNRDRPKNAPTDLKGSGEFRSYHLADFDENSDEFHRVMRHGYLACTSYSDKLVGDVLAELDRLGLAENTIVVLWGDHGWALGELGIWGKHTTLEESLRSPLIIRAPGMAQPGTASQAIVEAIDIYPTLADLCNVPIPVLEGRSFAPALANPALPAKANALSFWNRNGTNGYSMRTDRYRIVRWGTAQAPVQIDLFDYQTDPAGTQSITATQPQVVTDLLSLLP